MKQRDARVYLYDALQACVLVCQFTAGKGHTDYSGDPFLRSAVERQLEIVGEAMNRALKCDPSLANELPESSKIIAFRNRLVHAYFAISDAVVWRIVESDVPILRDKLRRLLPPDEVAGKEMC
ncbi:MAG: DUF86 domain-containing protein [Candidatus Schekmanbacteria bacterium]|nr:DUF86 domain-containing protein [Candidatus Schekmanbacteria bacterium]